MKTRLLNVVLAALLAAATGAGFAAESNAAAEADLKALVTKIQAKLKNVKNEKPTEADFAPELNEFDALLAKYQGDKSDEVAQILVMKATLYSEVFDDETKGEATLAQLKRDFPDSKTVAMLEKQKARQEAIKKIQATLKVGAAFPDFNEKDLAGKPLSIAGFKGKVVLLDFWATWCGPCVAELPNVLAAYEKHHAQGFEIIGISLDRDRQKLENFVKEKKMTWPQHFDEQGVLAQQYGVQSIPTTYLLDGEGKIIASNLRGEAVEAAVAKALAKK